MATLVLTAVGTALGGPIGGLIGSLAGQYVDHNVLFAPKPRHGPRLGDLAVQTSIYGTAIPRIFGRMRVAGCVIWATDLIETRLTTGGGKGQPKLVSYDYSASFAVALSSRPIRAVGRIWADGKLLRGAAGDFKAATQFRFYVGDEDQEPDPLIAAAEGPDLAPGFRGIAYAVFENLALADFGNRIPSLTFEIEGDSGEVEIGAIAATVSDGEIESAVTPSLIGYAAAGSSVRSAIEALSDVVPLSLADRAGRLELTAVAGEPVDLTGGESCARVEMIRWPLASVPDEVSLAYYAPERDFQTGLQRATAGAGGAPRNADRRALPAALGADAAKALAELRLEALRAGRVSARLRLPWSRAELRPGDTIRLEGEAALWRVQRCTLGAMTVELELLRIRPGALPPLMPSNAGSAVKESDRVHGPTDVHFFELPAAEAGADRPLLLVAAAGPQPGWRRAALMVSVDGGASWEEAGTTVAPATMGETLSGLAPAGAMLFDAASTVDVELLNSAMWLEHASDDALAGGANLALIGDELVQFGRAEWLSGQRFRLSRLLRGRRGSEWAAPLHMAGERFVLIERPSLAAIEAPAASLGGEARLSASGIGDVAGAATAILTVAGESIRPPSPVHLVAERMASGDITVRWVRRSRLGWSWSNGADAPLAEESETYRILLSGTGFARSAAAHVPAFVYSAAAQAEDGVAGPIEIAVAQIGTHAASRPAIITFA